MRALKPADDGRGVMVRLVSYAPGAVAVRLAFGHANITQAVLCDALEREVRELQIGSGSAVVPVDAGAIVTARVVFAKPA